MHSAGGFQTGWKRWHCRLVSVLDCLLLDPTNNFPPFRAFALSVYVFVILFLRYKSSPAVRYTTLGGGWIFIIVIVLVGPTMIQTDAQSPYFGPSGYW